MELSRRAAEEWRNMDESDKMEWLKHGMKEQEMYRDEKERRLAAGQLEPPETGSSKRDAGIKRKVATDQASHREQLPIPSKKSRVSQS